MPIRVLDKLPAVDFLRKENIFLMTTESSKNMTTVNSLKVLILNLMPKKIETENQLLRLLSCSPLQIDVQLLRVDQHTPKNTPVGHLNNFYCNFIDIKNEKYDGLVITGAPLGLIKFCDVFFWTKIKEIIQWAIQHVTSTLFICWAAQAALNILYDIPQMIRKNKLMGIYKHDTLDSFAFLTRGFDDTFLAPHSRYTDFPTRIIRTNTDLEVLAASEEIGAYLFASYDKRIVCVTGHPEYDSITLANEYFRDLRIGLNPVLPVNYFPQNNSNLIPTSTWRSHGCLLFTNWIHYYVNQV
ncbi:homoserine O-succinyltransferase [Blochmannia endosymbiont of Camponotus (Colobopsis) obliquus]|uniref:homoserine O-succinyltransferase n=1 Tax=Blochmannia endosymbiont of Camponotus (Colobopsis) obliquus TaxID=1505597 RepID=UPI00061A81AD|nr:homoserine O-succinyltransferase [Blochmannia endosymbiont of Camponotus (Colobopsis) obliquus]AKC60769.1 homoserine O-succinyltransferase [Blochmannia endosymbiont of Camponotus (Colobopsis) obliquus]